MELGAIDLIKQHVAVAFVFCIMPRHHPAEDQFAVQAESRSSSGSKSCVVGLESASRDDCVASLCNRLT